MDVMPPQPEAPAASPKREKRKGRRDPLAATLTILWGAGSQEEHVSRANLIDISGRGARFRVAERIPSGSWLMFNHHQAGVAGRGTVRYCRMVKSAYHVGVEFSGGTGWNPIQNVSRPNCGI